MMNVCTQSEILAILTSAKNICLVIPCSIVIHCAHVAVGFDILSVHVEH